MTISGNGAGAVAAGAGLENLALSGGASRYHEVDGDQREKIQAAGRRFGELTGGKACLVLVGRIIGRGDPEQPTEQRVQRCCAERFGFPKSPPQETINVILDSTGGPLDSAFRTVLFLSRYAENLNIYVPRKAKSASTLIAIGANTLVMSPFSELGPLDTQIIDPRNPTDHVSALDFYQSVDHVRGFGFATMSQALKHLAFATQGRIPLVDSLGTAAEFAIGSITPMLTQVNALNFGGWGRSLKIGERYAQLLLARVGLDHARAEKIAKRLVYGYTHHLFPIDIMETKDIGLNPQEMSAAEYESAFEIVSTCADNQFCVEFIEERKQAPAAQSAVTTVDGMAAHLGG